MKKLDEKRDREVFTKLMDMDLHDRAVIDQKTSVLRVPMGWVYCLEDGDKLIGVFVPLVIDDSFCNGNPLY